MPKFFVCLGKHAVKHEGEGEGEVNRLSCSPHFQLIMRNYMNGDTLISPPFWFYMAGEVDY